MAFTVTNNSPGVGYIAWTNVNIQWDGVSYPITNGNTSLKFVYWDKSASTTTFQTADVLPALTSEDVLVFANKSGTAVVIPGSSVVEGALIVDGTVLANSLAANSVTSDKILAGAVVAEKIGALQIVAGKIAAGAVDTAELNAGAVTAAKITAGTITATEIASNAITTAKLNAGAVTATKIATGTITATQIASNAITTVKLNASAVTAAKIATGTITATQIAAGTITATQIAAGTITATELAVDSISAGKIQAGAVKTSELDTNSVTATKIVAGAIIAGKISADAVEAGNLAANAVVAGNVAANAITAGTIATDAVTAGTIAANAITASKISALSLEATKYIRSTSFTTGVSGWSIHADGTAEFQDVTARGTLETGVSGERIKVDSNSVDFHSGLASEHFPASLESGAIDAGLAAETGYFWLKGHTLNDYWYNTGSIFMYSEAADGTLTESVAIHTGTSGLLVARDQIYSWQPWRSRWQGATLVQAFTYAHGAWKSPPYSTLNVEGDDTYGFFDDANDRFTIPTEYEAGSHFKVSIIVNWDGNNTGYRVAELIWNDGTTHYERFGYINGQQGSQLGASGSTVLQLDPGDWVDWRGYQNSGGNLGGDVRFSIEYVGSPAYGSGGTAGTAGG